MKNSQKNDIKKSSGKDIDRDILEIDVDRDINDVQIMFNKLFSDNSDDLFNSILYFADYLEKDYIPDSLLTDFSQKILHLLYTFRADFPPEINNSLLFIVHKMMDVLSEDYNFLDIKIGNNSFNLLECVFDMLDLQCSHLLLGSLLKNIDCCKAFFNSDEHVDFLKKNIMNDNYQTAASFIELVSVACDEKDCIYYFLHENDDGLSILDAIFDRAHDTNPDILESAMILVCNLMKYDIGQAYIRSKDNINEFFKLVTLNPTLLSLTLRFINKVVLLYDNPYYFIRKFDLEEALFSAINGGDNEIRLFLLICSLLTTDEDALTPIFQNNIHIFLIKYTIVAPDVKTKRMAVIPTMKLASVANDEQLESMISNNILDVIFRFINDKNKDVIMSTLQALSVIVNVKIRQNDKQLLSHIFSTSELTSRLVELTEEEEGAIRSLAAYLSNIEV